MINEKLNKDILDLINENTNEITKIKRKILWTNTNPTNIFASQTITLSESLDNYEYYEILFKQTNINARTMTTGKIPVGYGTILSWNTSINMYRPTETTVSGNTISFEDGKTTNGVDNSTTIPIKVIGHKA